VPRERGHEDQDREAQGANQVYQITITRGGRAMIIDFDKMKTDLEEIEQVRLHFEELIRAFNEKYPFTLKIEVTTT
jgi:hypothetical protein